MRRARKDEGALKASGFGLLGLTGARDYETVSLGYAYSLKP